MILWGGWIQIKIRSKRVIKTKQETLLELIHLSKSKIVSASLQTLDFAQLLLSTSDSKPEDSNWDPCPWTFNYWVNSQFDCSFQIVSVIDKKKMETNQPC